MSQPRCCQHHSQIWPRCLTSRTRSHRDKTWQGFRPEVPSLIHDRSDKKKEKVNLSLLLLKDGHSLSRVHLTGPFSAVPSQASLGQRLRLIYTLRCR